MPRLELPVQRTKSFTLWLRHLQILIPTQICHCTSMGKNPIHVCFKYWFKNEFSEVYFYCSCCCFISLSSGKTEFCLLVMLNTDLGVLYQLITGARLWVHNSQWFKSRVGVWILNCCGCWVTCCTINCENWEAPDHRPGYDLEVCLEISGAPSLWPHCHLELCEMLVMVWGLKRQQSSTFLPFPKPGRWFRGPEGMCSKSRVREGGSFLQCQLCMV